MGYRSSVQYWFEGKNAVSVVMEHMTLSPNQECFNELVVTDTGVYFECSDCKWYSGYDDVQWHTQLYNKAQDCYHEDGEMYHDLCGQFVRIGEDTLDIEEEVFGDDPWDRDATIRIVRYAEYNFPSKPEA